MASFFHVTLAVFMLVVTQQACSEELQRPETALMAAFQGVVQAMECFSHTTKEGLRLHQENSNTLSGLRSLQSLEDKIDKIAQGNSDLKSLIECKDKTVLGLTQSIQDLINKLGTRDKAEETLSVYVTELKQQLQDKETKVKELDGIQAESVQRISSYSDNEKRLNNTVQELERKLQESQQQVQQLQSTVNQLNLTVEDRKKELRCTRPHEQEIKQLVLDFLDNKDWHRMSRELRDLLDHDSQVYKELLSVSSYPLYWVGRGGNYALATLLLCAGLPANTADRDGDAMLHGAAVEGQLQMVQLLIQQGADVNKRGSDNSTPLMKAALYRGKLDVVQELVQAGANTTLEDDGGNTALDLASRSTDKTDVVEYLQGLPH